MSLLDLSQNLPSSLTFSSGFRSIVRNAMQLTAFEGVPPEFLQSLNIPFGFYLSYLSVIQDCQIRVFAGQQPSSADDDEGTQCIVKMEKTSQEVLIEDGIVIMRVVMDGIARDSGVASWVRVYKKRLGETETAIRFDGSAGSWSHSGVFLQMSNPYILRHSEVNMILNVRLPDNHIFLKGE